MMLCFKKASAIQLNTRQGKHSVVTLSGQAGNFLILNRFKNAT